MRFLRSWLIIALVLLSPTLAVILGVRFHDMSKKLKAQPNKANVIGSAKCTTAARYSIYSETKQIHSLLLTNCFRTIKDLSFQGVFSWFQSLKDLLATDTVVVTYSSCVHLFLTNLFFCICICIIYLSEAH